MKNGFDGLVRRLDMVESAASLKVCPFHCPKWNAKEQNENKQPITSTTLEQNIWDQYNI